MSADDTPAAPQRSKWWVDIVAGSVGGMASVIAGQPFDVIKNEGVLLASFTPTFPFALPTGSPNAHAQLMGFYKGITPPLAAETVYNLLYFLSYGAAKRFLQPDPNKEFNYSQYFLAGTFSGFVGSVAIAPVDLIKVRVQLKTEMGDKRVKPSDVIRQEGPTGFYQGYGSVLLRESTQMGVYFLAYEIAKEYTRRWNGGKDSVPGLLLSGATAGVAGWTCNYPVDVIKTRMQSSTEYKSVGDAVKGIYRNEGFGGFWKGLGACTARAVPTNAVLFLVYELVAQHLNNLSGDR